MRGWALFGLTAALPAGRESTLTVAPGAKLALDAGSLTVTRGINGMTILFR